MPLRLFVLVHISELKVIYIALHHAALVGVCGVLFGLLQVRSDGAHDLSEVSCSDAEGDGAAATLFALGVCLLMRWAGALAGKLRSNPQLELILRNLEEPRVQW